jgi:RHS repeat-associated protein
VAETCQGLPFGDELNCSGGDVSPLHFTGKQRDSESGLDNFGARYDASSLGRFMSPDWSAGPEDVPYADFTDPQTLDLYIYVQDNPVSKSDAQGHCGSDDPTCYVVLGAPVVRLTANVERTKELALGTLDLVAAYYTGGASLAAESPLLQAVGVVATGGLMAKGASNIAGAASDTKPKDIQAGTEAVTAASNPVGLAVTLATGGNLKAGAAAAEISSATKLAEHPAEAAKNPAETALTVGHLAVRLRSAFGAAKAWLRSTRKKSTASKPNCGASEPDSCGGLPPPGGH